MSRNQPLKPLSLLLPCFFLSLLLGLWTAITAGQQRLRRAETQTDVLLTLGQSPGFRPSISDAKRRATVSANYDPRDYVSDNRSMIEDDDNIDPLFSPAGGPSFTETDDAPPTAVTAVNDANLRPLYTEFPSMSPTLLSSDAGPGSDVSSSPPTEPTEAPAIQVSSTAPVVSPTTTTENPTMQFEPENLAPVVTTAPATSSPIAVLLPLTGAPVPVVVSVSSSPIQDKTDVPTTAENSSPSESPLSTDSDGAAMDGTTKPTPPPPTDASSVSSSDCKDMDEFVFWVSTDQMARNCAWLRTQHDSIPDTNMCTSNGVPYYICQASCGSCENVNAQFKQQIEELLP